MLKLISQKIAQVQPGKLDDLRPDNTHGEQGIIDEENYEDVLADQLDVEEPETEEVIPGQIEAPIEPAEPIITKTRPPGPQTGIPEEAEKIDEYESGQKLVYDGMDNLNVIVFDYVTRHGIWAGRRVFEPHYSFLAKTTGNEIVIGWDRSVNDIRSFIVSNIRPISRYPKVLFKPKAEIMVGSG